MKIFTAFAALVLCGVPSMAQQTAVPPKPESRNALDKPTLEAFIRNLMLWNPQISVVISDPRPAPMPGFKEFTVAASAGQASVEEFFYVSDDGRKVVRGSVYDVNQSPFQITLDKLKTDNLPVMGPPGAQVKLVVFSDFQCTYCRQEAKTLRENLLKTYPKEVNLFFKDLPLDQIHPWARTAAIAGRCVYREKAEAFWDYHDWIFDKQPEIKPENLREKIAEWAQGKQLDPVKLNGCIESRATEAEINASIAEARILKVSSTPTLFINGRMLTGSVPWVQLKTIIDWEIDQSKRAALDSEKCCSLELPTPLAK